MTLSLVVDAPGAVVRRSHNHLVVGRESQRVATAPLTGLRDVTLIGRVEVTSSAVEALLDGGIPLVWLSGTGRVRGILNAETIAGLAARRAQHAAWTDPARRLSTAVSFVLARLENARALGLRFTRARRHPGQARTLAAIERASAHAETATDLDTLRGHEGYGTRAWFRLIRTLVPADWGFVRRTRRPPTDPLSSLLSFGYSVVTARCAAAALVAGLDPACGFLHDARAGRPAIALDLMEEMRAPLVESVVLNVVRRRMIRLEDFEHGANGVRITAPARRILLEQLQRRLDDRIDTDRGRRRYATVIVDQAHELTRALRDGRPYEPLRIR